MKRINTEQKEYDQSIKNLKTSFLKRGYKEKELEEHFHRASNKDRNELLKQKDRKTKPNRIPFITTFNDTLPNIRQAIQKTWNILHINDEVKKSFTEEPFIAYRRNSNLRDLIGQTTIIDNKTHRNTNKFIQGKCTPCLNSRRNLCCKQVKETKTFTSNITKREYQIYHKTNCRSRCVIYLMECRKCKIQYIGKTKTAFNERLNKHRSDTAHPTPTTIPADRHFANPQHNFQSDAKFTIIEEIKGQSKSIEEKDNILLKRENFWITKLKTLKPLGLNQELNNI